MLFWILVLIAIFVIIFVYYFNKIAVLDNRIKNAWSQIDVQLKKRADLIPNLVETVKGYMRHERRVLTEVTKARTAMLKAKTPEAKVKAGNQLATALKTLFAVAENYPKLRANENFLMLQEELAGIESKIAYARQFYNDSVLEFNNLIKTFPGVIFAKMLGKKEHPYFEISEVERKPVKVKFE